MTQESFSEKMRGKLAALRAELVSLAQTGADASRVVELDQSKVGRLSRMDAMQAQAMSQASGRRRELKLKMIDVALQRIDNGVFGTCQTCDEPIATKRLEFDPTVSLCIDCDTEVELGGN